MTSKLGPYWSVEHRRKEDYQYFSALQPSVHLVMDGGPPDYAFVLANEPNTLTLARDWALSEQHSDMLANPIATGQRHAQEWNNHQANLGFDRQRTLILGINEPKVWEDGVTAALRLYTISLCAEAKKYGLRVGAMQLGVGWPNNNGPDTPPDWSLWQGVEQAILDNNGCLVTHEYWADNGPSENWGWWGGRTLKCPWQVPIVIGETGVDMFVKDTSVGQQNRGWLGHMPPERYANELWEYTNRMGADPRFVGCCVFASDFQAHEWYSFDVQPAYNAILAGTPWVKPADTVPVVIHLPDIGNAPTQPTPPPTSVTTPMFVTAAAGLNLREQPSVTANVITSIPLAEQVDVFGPDDANPDWFKASYQDNSGYVYSKFLSDSKPVATTPPQTPGDNFARCLAWVLEQEGGFVNNPADPGGATNKGVTIDTFTSWRKAQGKPAPTVEELRALSDAEANQIYHDLYWVPSGADQLAYPLCLAQLDTATNAGPARAKEMLSRSGGNFDAYMGYLIQWYASIPDPDWANFGRAWTRRRGDLLIEAAKG